MSKSAVLLLAHGTPETLADIPEYLKNVTSGRPLPVHVIEEISHRYGLIGSSPLTRLTFEQGRLLSESIGLPVYIGMRNWKPYIVDTVNQMRDDGIESAVVICLAPQNSRTSVGLYRRAALAGAGNLAIDFIEGWAEHPLLADAFAERLQTKWRRFCEETGSKVPVLFTAHSVPCRTIQVAVPETGSRPVAAQDPDPYPVEAKHTAALVAERIDALTADNWFFAFQSQGMSGGPWIGPTVEDTLTSLRAAGHTAVLIHAIGFLCDHVEILYDIDIGFREYGAKIGLRVERPESLNSSPILTAALADLAHHGLARLATRSTAVAR